MALISNCVQVDNGSVLLLTGGNLVRLDVIVSGGVILSSAVGDGQNVLMQTLPRCVAST